MKNPIPIIKSQWQEMTPSQKALAVTASAVVTAVNPFYFLVYGATYLAYSSRDGAGTEEEGCTCDRITPQKCMYCQAYS